MDESALQVVRRLADLGRRLADLETRESYRASQSTANVSNPPTDAQLDSAFGTPAALGDGFVGAIDDAAGGSTFWLCVTINGVWAYVRMTKAV